MQYNYNYTNLATLEKAILDRDFDLNDIQEDIEFVENTFDKFRKYFNAVYEHVMGGESAKLFLQSGLWDTEKFQNKIMDLDTNRKIAHDCAIDACRILNRYCDVHGINHICPSTENRGEIADYVGKLMNSIYQKGIYKGTQIDEIIEKEKLEFGDRLALDAAIITAQKEKRNPEQAYKKEDEKIDHKKYTYEEEIQI